MATIEEFLSWVKGDFYQAGLHVELVAHGSDGPDEKFITIRLHTDANTYRVRAVERPDGGYLGCTAKSRKARAGEDWLRGNDRPDGKLTKETWDRIKASIVSYELVRVHRNCLDGEHAWNPEMGVEMHGMPDEATAEASLQV